MNTKRTVQKISLLAFLLASILFSAAARVPQSRIAETTGFGIPRDSAWSADGSRYLVVTTSSAQVYAWDGELLTLEDTIESTRHLRSGAISSDGREIFLGTEEGWIEHWDGTTGEKVKEWQAHSLVILDLILNEDRSQLMSIAWQSHPMLWNSESAAPLALFETSSLGARAGAFLSDGKIVLWSKWLQVQVFNADGSLFTQHATQQFNTPPVFSANGSLLGGVFAGRVQLIETLSGKLLREINPGFSVSGVFFSTDNTTLVIYGEGQVLMVDTASGKLREAFSPQNTSAGLDRFSLVSLAPGETQLVFVADQILMRDLDVFAIVTRFLINARADDFIVSPDANILASRVEKLPYVEIWQAGGSKPVQLIEGFTLPVQDFAFLPDGQLVTSADSIRFWDPLTGELIDEWQLNLSAVEDALAVWVYNAETKETERIFLEELPTGKLAINEDGSLLAVESLDGKVSVFSVQTGGMLASFDLAASAAITKLQSSVDALVFDGEARLAVFLTDGTLQRFDLLTGEEDAQISLPTPLNRLSVCALAYPADQAFPTYATQAGLFSYHEDQHRFVEAAQTGFCGAPQLASAAVMSDGRIIIEEAGMMIFTDALQPYSRTISAAGDHLILQEGRYNQFIVQVRSLPEKLPETWESPLTERSYGFDTVRASHFDSKTDEVILVDASGLVKIDGEFHQLQLDSAAGITAAAIASDGGFLLASLEDGQVLYFSDSAAQPDILFEGKSGRSVPSRAVAFSQDDGLKAAGDDLGILRVWDAQNHLTLVETGGGAVQQLLFSPDDNYLAVCGTEFISLWQISQGTDGIVLEPLSQRLTGTLMAFSPGGTRFAAATQADFHDPIKVWDFPSFAQGKSFDLPITSLKFSSEERFYAISTDLWVCNLGESCRTIETPETFTMGDLMIAPDENEAIVITADGRVVKIDLTTE